MYSPVYTELPPAITALHKLYCALAGLSEQDVPLTWTRVDAWRTWQALGMGEAEVRDLFAYLRGERNAGNIDDRSFLFRNTIEQADRAQENVALYRRRNRPRRVPQTAVEQAQGVTDNGDPVRAAKDVMGPKPDWSKMREAVERAETHAKTPRREEGRKS